LRNDAIQQITYPSKRVITYAYDVNGGITNVSSPTKTYAVIEPSEWAIGSYAGSHGTHLADGNGDNRADVVSVGDLGIQVLLSSYTSFTPAESWTIEAFYGSRATAFADVDGDHKADAIAVNPGNLTVRRAR
jgi:hypothetical protein